MEPVRSKVDLHLAHGEVTEDHPDPLVSCLQIVAQRFNRPTSLTVLTAGLPHETEHFTPELIARAAKRIELVASVRGAALGKQPPFTLPIIIALKKRGPVVLLERSGDRVFEAALPGRNETITLSELEITEDYAGWTISFAEPQRHAGLKPGGATKSSENWFWAPLRTYWKSMVQVILAASVINALALASPLFVMNVYDRVLPNKAISSLWVLAIGLSIAFIFDFLLKVSRATLIDYVGRKLDIHVSSALFEKVMNIRLQERPESTGVFANHVSQYEYVREFFTSSTLSLLVDVCFLFVFLFVIYLLGGWMVVVPLVAVVLVAISGLVLQAFVSRYLARAQSDSAQRHGLLVESVTAMETVKSLRAEGYFLAKWERFIQEGSRTQSQIKAYSSLAVNIAQFLQQMTTVWVVVTGVYRFAENEITMGVIIAVVMLSGRAVAPLTQMTTVLTRARYAFAALKTLDDLMGQPDERVGVKDYVNRIVLDGELEFRNVSFQYPAVERSVLNGVSFHIKPGEKVGILGPIGSGKTTLARLASGLYTPTSGEVLIDGVDARQYHPYEVRKAVGLVVQETDLFRGSLKENVLIAKPGATDDEILFACRMAGVDTFAARHPMGYDMPVGERGSFLSSGQIQSIALARVFLISPPILFLDEPSSALDLAAEKILIQHLKEAIWPDQTLILATHRQAMLELVERLIVVDNGKVVADGPKQRVLAALAERAAARASAQGPRVSANDFDELEDETNELPKTNEA
ncbi:MULTISPECIES: type I secretion system permease/ATPase [Pseudovibrio]|uniref:type I secretion system permease/ATPase n=1 Tax=Stappiaceae TaxID=2821832 RepID=UPI0023672454|nr:MULTISPECIES: type I secretion system permease/ATPase [Pseudovibrio]MDD7909609.1 type I secretion system permease/ATPase [Pseudovibrio exalbescens]MDX5591935.1 type I secretion system permease/ATPase [Pseudovibrio sp. SPO723]